MLARALADLGAGRYIGNLLLPARVQTTTGSINYELADEGITAADVPTVVAPGAEYKLTTVGAGTAATATLAKWGQDTLITDEAISRFNFQAIIRALTKLVNSAKLLIDSAVIAQIATSVTATAAAASKWDGSGTTPAILKDILKAQAAMRNLGLGYEANALIVADSVWPHLAADATIAAAMAREDRSNPIYTGRFSALAGVEIIPVPTANLPGGLASVAYLIDRGNLGFILTENIDGGYTSAGDLVETKSYREEGSDAVRVRARSLFKAVVTDPGAGYEITGVL